MPRCQTLFQQSETILINDYKPPRIPLEVHSNLSFLQGTASPKALVTRAVEDGLSHLALTDTHGLYGAVAFSQACQQSDIQPIIGLTLHLRPETPTALPGEKT